MNISLSVLMKVRPKDNHKLTETLWFYERTPKLQISPA